MNKLNKFALALLSLGAFISCDDEFDGTSQLVDERPVLSTDVSSIDLVEGGDAQTVTFTLDKVSSKTLKYRVELVDGTFFNEGADLKISNLERVSSGTPPNDAYQIEVPPYTDTVSFNISAILDGLTTESAESKVLRVTPNANMLGNAKGDNILIDVNIQNVATLAMNFAWNSAGSINLGGTDYSICQYTDVDIYLATAENFDINSPSSNNVGLNDAATGSCPEKMVLKEGQLADGDYVLYSVLYQNQFSTTGDTTSFAMHTTFTKGGVFSETLIQDESQAYNASTPANDFNSIIAYITISGANFTVKDYQQNVIASGKMSNGNMK